MWFCLLQQLPKDPGWLEFCVPQILCVMSLRGAHTVFFTPFLGGGKDNFQSCKSLWINKQIAWLSVKSLVTDLGRTKQ